MNVYTLYSVTGYFPFGEQMCRVYIWVDFTVWSASLASLAMIMLDRYLSLQINSRYKDPTNHRFHHVIEVPNRCEISEVYTFQHNDNIDARLYLGVQRTGLAVGSDGVRAQKQPVLLSTQKWIPAHDSVRHNHSVQSPSSDHYPLLRNIPHCEISLGQSQEPNKDLHDLIGQLHQQANQEGSREKTFQ